MPRLLELCWWADDQLHRARRGWPRPWTQVDAPQQSRDLELQNKVHALHPLLLDLHGELHLHNAIQPPAGLDPTSWWQHHALSLTDGSDHLAFVQCHNHHDSNAQHFHLATLRANTVIHAGRSRLRLHHSYVQTRLICRLLLSDLPARRRRHHHVRERTKRPHRHKLDLN